MKDVYLVSACLLGVNCRYNGTSSHIHELKDLVNSGRVIPICPEVLAGFDTPRESCEIITQIDCSLKVMSERGLDYTSRFQKGAQKVLEIAKICQVKKVILKTNSPSCGSGYIYDGTFSGNLIKGNGITSKIFIENDIKVYNEMNWESGGFI